MKNISTREQKQVQFKSNEFKRVLPVEEFGWEEAFQASRETATSVFGLLYHMWDQSLLGKHPKIRLQEHTGGVVRCIACYAVGYCRWFQVSINVSRC